MVSEVVVFSTAGNTVTLGGVIDIGKKKCMRARRKPVRSNECLAVYNVLHAELAKLFRSEFQADV